MKNYPYLNSVIKKNNRVYKLLTVLFLLITIISIIVSIIIDSRPYPDPHPLNNAIYDEVEDQWSYVDVEIMSDYFAVYEEDEIEVHRYYFIWDDEYLYVALLDTSTFDQLQEIYEYSFTEEDISAPQAVRINGMSEEISEDLKAIAIEQLNEWYGDGYVTEDTFAQVVGNYMINVKENPNQISGIPFTIAFISFILFIVFGIIVVVVSIQNKKTFEHVNSEDLYKIEEEIQNGTTYHIHGIDIHLTNKFIVDLTSQFQVYAFDDICWIYLQQIKQYGITTSLAIKIGLKNGKIKTIGTVPRKYKNDINNIMLEAINYCDSQVLVGYTKENKKTFKNLNKDK